MSTSIFDGHACYQIGPMDYVSDGGKNWRHDLTPFLKNLGIRVLDPTKKALRKQDLIEDENTWSDVQKMKSEGRFDEIRPKYGRIRSVDLRMVSRSDFIICRLDYSNGVIMSGTIEELVTANREKKPCLVYVADGNKCSIPFWFWLMLPAYSFFSTIDEIKDHLLEMDKNGGPTGQELTDGRWTLFDWSVNS